MKSFYLIDFENVHDAGLSNLANIESGSEIHFFYSTNANKLNAGAFKPGVLISIMFHNVVPGKQSLDMFLSSYLGYLIGKNENLEGGAKFIIVSNDKDYDNTISVWKNSNVDVSVMKVETKKAPKTEKRIAKIVKTDVLEEKKVSENTPHEIIEQQKPSQEPEKQVQKPQKGVEITQLNNEIMSALGKLGLESQKMGSIASFSVKNHDKLQTIYHEIVKICGMKKGVEVYNSVKNILLKKSGTAPVKHDNEEKN